MSKPQILTGMPTTIDLRRWLLMKEGVIPLHKTKERQVFEKILKALDVYTKKYGEW